MSSSTSVTAKHASRPFRVGSDGLPLLPCHDVRVTVAFAEAARTPPPPRAVSAFGSVDSPAAVRRQLEALYARTQQLPALSEATLRADTELELLRRQCFAQRNAQWGYTTPDQLEFRPQPHAQWTPQPANAKLALRQAKIDGALDKELAFSAADGARSQDQPLRPVRDRPWPPAEFALKTVAKPARGRGGKRKAAPMAAVLDPVPLLARTCRECGTQSTPLWRSQNKEQTPVDAQQQAQAATPTPPTAPQKLGLCLQCYLKLERADLFDKKRVEKRREERRKKEQAAAAALQEKKRLKHQIHALKKQQKQEAQLAVDDEQLMEGQVPQEQEQQKEAQVILKFTREEIEAATGSSKDRKKDRKHSRKDKKKKKKKHRRKHELEVESDSDGPTPIPSPAQMNGFVYADRAPEPYTTPQTSAFTVDHAVSARGTEALVVDTEPEALDGSDDRGFNEEGDMASTRARSSRKRKSVQRAEPVVVEESPSSASKKRKTSSSRPSRSKRSAASAPPAPVVVAVPPAPIVKKRARTKKELARERELRALGQYCPVCSEVYEDDDQNTFVCCDSCELWVHGACDPSLTPELIAAMANTEDKYICPLCAGR